jgi:hypothetical protein
MEDRDVILESDGKADHVGENQIRSQESQKGEEQGHAWKEINTEKGPEGEDKGYRIERLEERAEKEEFSVGFTL